MKKESNFDVLLSLSDGFTKKTWQDHKVVILDPD